MAYLEKGAQLLAQLISPTGGAVAYHKSVWQTLSWWDHVYPATLKEYSSHDIILDFSTSYRSEPKGIKQTLEANSKTAVTNGVGQYVNNLQATESINQAFLTP